MTKRVEDPPRRPLGPLDPERVRCRLEGDLLAQLARTSDLGALAGRAKGFDGARVRRDLLARSLRLSAAMAPAAHRMLEESARVLGLAEGTQLELYQSAGPENAAMHLVEAPVLVEVQGRLLTQLDEVGLLSVFGHELGHYLAHGPAGTRGEQHLAARALARSGDEQVAFLAQQLGVAAEITADRFGLLACQDLPGMLRTQMSVTTGLPVSALTWDTDAYLAQCRELMEACLEGADQARSGTHPEHHLRAYAVWLFSESDVYHALTGKGSGQRPIADVEDTLATILGRPELDVAYDPLEAPPLEVFEFALAAAVIVAWADEELAPEESELVERIFAPLVPDWQTYLDLESARARLARTAPIVRSGGADLARRVFLLLVHMLGADGTIDEREVGAVLGVGVVLGQQALFERWMVAALAALKVHIVISDVAPQVIPLPARHADVLDALDAFLDGVCRRGSGSIVFRRLLHLVGQSELHEGAVTAIEGAFDARQVRVVPPLRHAQLDDVLHLEAPLTTHDDDDDDQGSAAPDPSRQQLVRGLSRLRDQLISGDGRSPSVRLRTVRNERGFDVARLDRISLGMGERALTHVRAGRVARLVDASEAGTHRAAEECGEALDKLDRAHRDRVEETGSHDLYVGYPFLTGAVAQKTALVAYPVRGPLLLFPVDLVRDSRGARSFKLAPRKDEDPIVNQSLLRLMFNKLRFGFPDSLAEELDTLASDREVGLGAVLARLAELGVDVQVPGGALRSFEERADIDQGGPRLEVEEVAVLGLFPQSSSDLLQDYDALIQELSEGNTPVPNLLASATVLLPAALRGQRLPPPAQSAAHPLMDADPAQREVLSECLKHEAMVIDGPPGTGKSQVIANLVLDALRRGERVAVVCEKRAALDVVFQRIERLGLRHALALVHDVHEDRKALYAQIAERLDGFTPLTFDVAAAEALHQQHAATAGELDARRAALAWRAPGATLGVGELLTLRAATAPEPDGPQTTSAPDAPAGPLPEWLAGLDLTTLSDVLGQVVALHAEQEFWAPGSPWRAAPGEPPRATLASAGDAELRALVTRTEAAIEAARHFAAAPAALAPDALDAVTDVLAGERDVRALRSEVPDGDALYVAVRAADALDAAVDDFEDADAQLARERAAVDAWDEPVLLEPSAELVAALAVLQGYAGRFVRFFVWAWWSARSRVTRSMSQVWPERAGHPLDGAFLGQLMSRVRAAGVWRAATHAMAHLPGAPRLRNRRDLVAYLPAAARMMAHQRMLRRAAPQLAMARLPTSLGATSLPAWDAEVAARDDAHTRLTQLREAVVALRPYAPGLSAAPSAVELEALRDRLARDGARVARCDGQLARAEQQLPALRAVLDVLVTAHPDAGPERWRQALLHGWATAQLTRAHRHHPALTDYGTPESDERKQAAIARLATLDTQLSEIETERVLATLDRAPLLNVAAPEKHKRRSAAQAVWESLLKETRKKRNLLALRTFVRQFADEGLLDVVPVWLLSPETMAILFPREPLFDLVVFDEASQCTVESGLPVLLRAKRVVVAGDEQQMPPTSFFRMGGGDEEDASRSDASNEADRAEREVRDMLTSESLLTLSRSRVQHTALSWHYRCQDESLIAFSNHAMYGGELLTIPSTHATDATPGLRFVHLEDGEYDGGQNVKEAERVVTLLAELLAEAAPPTLGVVTFNLKQRAAVLQAIEQRVASDRAFGEAWTAAEANERLDERPFVKNLEAVQGDERDVIVFSLAHAPVSRKRRSGSTDRYVPARFGPLGQRGGERRLNVAISRAKQRCYIVSSFLPDLLSVAGSSHLGPQLFKRYLEYADAVSRGDAARAEGVLSLVRETRRSGSSKVRPLPVAGYVPIATQLALALERRGVPYELNVGTSDFRVPLAVLNPSDPSRFALAVLLDESGEGSSSFDRFVHRPRVLETRGWRVLEVDAATWAHRPEAVVQQILERVPGAEGALHTPAFRSRRTRNHDGIEPATSPQPAARARARDPQRASADEPAPSPSPRADLPAWAGGIPDATYQNAAVRLHAAEELPLAELTRLVGGARRLRIFEAELASWGVPFRIERVARGRSEFVCVVA
ncbi:MAG: DUF4011 domain-containing protein [Sandaracinaceae bacterium]|nr:DUF4011 domain-containing protein [Sandaracinaceae bacterium]